MSARLELRRSRSFRTLCRNLKPLARALLLTIICCIDRRTNTLRMSLATLARESGMSKASVIKYIAQMEASGLLRVTRSPGGKHDAINIYALAGAALVGFYGYSSYTPGVQQIDTDSIERRRISLWNESHSEASTGLFAEPHEGRDRSDRQDAPPHELRGKAAEAARQHPERLEVALKLAEQPHVKNPQAYAARVLLNGVYETAPPTAPFSDLSWADFSEGT